VHCLQLLPWGAYKIQFTSITTTVLELQEEVQPFISQAEWKQTTQHSQMLQHEGNKSDAYPFSMLLPVPGMHRKKH